MSGVSVEKIRMMLEVYREKLEMASTPPIEYDKGVRLQAQISILEHLYILAISDSAPVSETPAEV